MEILQLEWYSVKIKCENNVAHNVNLLHKIFPHMQLGVVRYGAKGPKLNYGAEIIE